MFEMFGSFCGCFNFWSSNEDQVDLNNLSSIDQPDVCLDVSKAGRYCILRRELSYSKFNYILRSISQVTMWLSWKMDEDSAGLVALSLMCLSYRIKLTSKLKFRLTAYGAWDWPLAKLIWTRYPLETTQSHGFCATMVPSILTTSWNSNLCRPLTKET